MSSCIKLFDWIRISLKGDSDPAGSKNSEEKEKLYKQRKI